MRPSSPPEAAAARQWGGRFTAQPDDALLQFGSSLRDDLPLAAFDVACSRAHVLALRGGGIIEEPCSKQLLHALAVIACEIEAGDFEPPADAEDIHGAIDRRVRGLCSNGSGEWLHAGRSRNDQVATTLLLYVAKRAAEGGHLCRDIARAALASARSELQAETHMAAVTHLQPAQPMLLAFWLCAVAEMFVRAAQRFDAARASAMRVCPLGSGAVSGSTLPLDRAAAARELGFEALSRNALDAIGNRDCALDVCAAFARALTDASRVSADIILWATPAFGYVSLDDAAATGSSLMPQKRNPDPFELVRAAAARAAGSASSAQGTLHGLGLSYHRDLQETKSLIVEGCENGIRALAAFDKAFRYVRYNRAAMNREASGGYTIATDVADALIIGGVSPRKAHELVGACVVRAERDGRPFGTADIMELSERAGVPVRADLSAMGSIRAKRTAGSTNPDEVLRSIEELEALVART